MSLTNRATIYFDADLHRAVRMKAAEVEKSVSDLDWALIVVVVKVGHRRDVYR